MAGRRSNRSYQRRGRLACRAVNSREQVIAAAGEGSSAAIAINADLVEDDVRNAMRAVRA